MSEPSPTTTSARSFAATLVALAVVFAVTWLLQVAAPRSTSARWEGLARNASLVWHQDWRVFTRVPIGTDTVVHNPADLTPITMYATSSANYWGLSRIAYAQWEETAALERAVPTDRWRDCAADTIEACRPLLTSAFRVVNPTRDATLCGPVVFAHESPVPWPGATHGTRRTSAVVLLDVTCGR